jgi:HlyD family secretion protein
VKSLRKKLAPLLVGLAVVGLLIYAFLPAAVEADVATVRRGALRVTVDEDGKTRIKQRYVVSAPLSGQLLRITLRPDDKVRQGQTLIAVIQPTDPSLLDARSRAQAKARVSAAEASRRQAEAQFQRAKAGHELAAAELARAQRLQEGRSIARQEFENAVHRERAASAELQAAQHAVRVADFELEQAQAALLRTQPRSPGEADNEVFEIRAPINGKVLRVFQESETVVSPGTRLLEIGNPEDLEIEIDVLSVDAVKIRRGAGVLLEHWGGTGPLQAEVRVVEPAGFTKISALGVEEQRVWVIADFVGPAEKWRGLGDGYRVEARIVTWEEADVLKVPAGALFRHEGDWAVFRIMAGRVALRPVRVGQGNGLETQILEGLQEGDQVVLYPSDRLANGVAVTPRRRAR